MGTVCISKFAQCGVRNAHRIKFRKKTGSVIRCHEGVLQFRDPCLQLADKGGFLPRSFQQRLGMRFKVFEVKLTDILRGGLDEFAGASDALDEVGTGFHRVFFVSPIYRSLLMAGYAKSHIPHGIHRIIIDAVEAKKPGQV